MTCSVRTVALLLRLLPAWQPPLPRRKLLQLHKEARGAAGSLPLPVNSCCSLHTSGAACTMQALLQEQAKGRHANQQLASAPPDAVSSVQLFQPTPDQAGLYSHGQLLEVQRPDQTVGEQLAWRVLASTQRVRGQVILHMPPYMVVT